MKKILHSGQFTDYDGNTIKVSFYKEYHLWVSTTSITAPYTGGEYDIEIWSDVGDAWISDSGYDWISDPIFKGSYRNADGHTVYKYTIQIAGRPFVGVSTTGSLNVGVEISDTSKIEGYEGDLKKTITITRR